MKSNSNFKKQIKRTPGTCTFASALTHEQRVALVASVKKEKE